MSEETIEVPVLPIEQRIAAVVVHDSIAKIVEEDKFDSGHCGVELLLHNYLPEYTPHDFSPSNDLEEFMFANSGATLLTLTLPFSFKIPDMVRGLGANMVRFEREYDCEVATYMKSSEGTIQVELINHKLNRSLYVTMKPQPNS